MRNIKTVLVTGFWTYGAYTALRGLWGLFTELGRDHINRRTAKINNA